MAPTQQEASNGPAAARRVLTLLSPGIAGPVASLWTSHLYATRPQEDVRPRQARFTVSHTEDALVSFTDVIPCAAEEFFRPMMQNKFSNAGKMQFCMGAPPRSGRAAAAQPASSRPGSPQQQR